MTTQQSTGLLLGQQLDEYRLEAILGQSELACVYRGLDTRLKRPAAIKVIKPFAQTNQDYKDCFERKAQAIVRLKHPHIVGVYRYGEANDLFYLAMEYIEGVNLAAVLAAYQQQQTLMPPAEISRIVRQLCLALDYAHSQGVIHRQVKPSNIMLDQQDQVILTDFGLALLDHEAPGQIFDSPHYLAPEQVIPAAGAGPQSDLYAVGVILYQMCTGKLPFDVQAARLLSEKPPSSPRDLNPQFNPALEAVILKALAKKPEDRYPTGAALSDALDQSLQAVAGPDQPLSPELPSIPAAVPGFISAQVQSSSTPGGVTSIGQPAERGENMTKIYYLRNIRTLLAEAFSAEDLRRLCHDEPSFRPVYYQLTENSSKVEIVDRLLEYADRTLQLDHLLALVKTLNPARYNEHRPYYDFTPGREPVQPDSSLDDPDSKNPADPSQMAPELVQAAPFRPQSLIELPIELLEQLRKDNVVLFCGEGISTGEGGLPSHHQLAQALAEEAGLGNISGRSLPEVAQDFEMQKGLNRLITKTRDLMEPGPPYRPLPTHELIASLPFKRIITTNWDRLLEKTLEQTRRLNRVIVDTDVPLLDETRTWLIYLHGSFERIDSLVITGDAYYDVSERLPETTKLVSSFFAHKTMLFLGFGLADPDFRRMHREMERNLGSFKRRAYAVQPNPDPLTVQFWRQKNVELIDADVLQFLQALQAKLEE